MKKSLIILLGVVLYALISTNLKAVECIEIGSLDDGVINLKQNNYQANNCFTLDVSSHQNRLHIHLEDRSNNPFSLKMLENDGSYSSWESANIERFPLYNTSSNVGNGNLTFYIEANSEDLNREVTVTSFSIDGFPQLVIEVKNLPTLSIPFDPLPTCRPGQMCNEPLSQDNKALILEDSIFSNSTSSYQLKSGESFYYNYEKAGDNSNCTEENSPPAMPDPVDLNANIREAKEFGDSLQDMSDTFGSNIVAIAAIEATRLI